MTAATVHLRWVDALPPAHPVRGTVIFDHHAIADALRSEPGRWAMLPDLPNSISTSIRSGTHAAYRPAGAFDAAVRQGNLYVRYVGGRR